MEREMTKNTDAIPSGKTERQSPPSYGAVEQQHPHDIITPRRGKDFLRPPVIHDGMHHTQDGQFNAGISKTASASGLQGYQLPTDPVKQHGSKTVPVPPCHPQMKSDSARGSYDPTRADRVIGEAILSGSTKLPATVKED
jgi:hypothetical protein